MMSEIDALVKSKEAAWDRYRLSVSLEQFGELQSKLKMEIKG